MRHFARPMLAVWVVVAASLPATAQEAGDVSAGADLARTWCSECHLIDRQQPRGNDAAPSFVAIAAAPGTTSMSLRAFLMTPHGRMPDLKLASGQIDDMVAYIMSFRRR